MGDFPTGNCIQWHTLVFDSAIGQAKSLIINQVYLACVLIPRCFTEFTMNEILPLHRACPGYHEVLRCAQDDKKGRGQNGKMGQTKYDQYERKGRG